MQIIASERKDLMDTLISILKAFIFGGLICAVCQIFIDKTKLTPARILVSLVVLGVIFVFVFVAVVDMIIPYISINGEHFTVASIEDGTIVYKYLVGKTPVTLLEDVLQKTGIK